MTNKFSWLEMKAHQGSKSDFNELWIYERKYDGSRHYFINGNHLNLKGRSLFSVRGIEKREIFNHLFKELEQLGNVLIDCEIYIEGGTVIDLNKKINRHIAKCCVFDILSVEGRDIRSINFKGRRDILKELFKEKEFKSIHLPETWNNFDEAWKSVADRNLEGVMAKYLNGNYNSGKRSRNWLKVKRKVCLDVDIIGHETGSTKGTFLCKTDKGVDIRVSGTSLDIVGYWREHKPKKMEISCMNITESGKPFQPVFEKFVE